MAEWALAAVIRGTPALDGRGGWRAAQSAVCVGGTAAAERAVAASAAGVRCEQSTQSDGAPTDLDKRIDKDRGPRLGDARSGQHVDEEDGTDHGQGRRQPGHLLVEVGSPGRHGIRLRGCLRRMTLYLFAIRESFPPDVQQALGLETPTEVVSSSRRVKVFLLGGTHLSKSCAARERSPLAEDLMSTLYADCSFTCQRSACRGPFRAWRGWPGGGGEFYCGKVSVRVLLWDALRHLLTEPAVVPPVF